MRLNSVQVGTRVEVTMHGARTFMGAEDEEPFDAIGTLDDPEEIAAFARKLLGQGVDVLIAQRRAAHAER